MIPDNVKLDILSTYIKLHPNEGEKVFVKYMTIDLINVLIL